MSVLRWAGCLFGCVGLGVLIGLAGLVGRAGADVQPRGGLRADAEGVRAAPSFTGRAPSRLGRAARPDGPPRIAVVIDDLGLDRDAFERVNALPGPLTLAFLPYGRDAQAMLDAARPVHEAILHLPMEPRTRVRDAGPGMLRVGSPRAIEAGLAANLGKLAGYAGVNNHTGSLFTADPEAMGVLLEALDDRGLYFLDSVTTPRPASLRLAAREGYRVVARDVFLDADYAGGGAAVRAQLAEAERIARQTGQAVVIGHPYRATTQTLGPWLVTAQARGFELVTVGELAEEARPRERTLAGLR